MSKKEKDTKEVKEKQVKEKKRFGDRRDGKLLRDLDPMHYTMPLLYPKRCDNEAFIADTIDLTAMDAYLEEFNKKVDGPRCSHFMVIVAAIIKTLMLRDRMNRFIVNGKTYQRNEVSVSFIIKKSFNDNGDEGLAFIHAKDDDTLFSIYKEINRQVNELRFGNTVDASSEAMEKYTKMLPHFIYRLFTLGVRFLDKLGRVPKSLIESDPYYSSVVLTYVGSLRLQSGYHHLTNWGTNSVFLSVGEKKLRPFYNRKGEMEMKDSIDVAFTIDERIADGYYYGKTIRLFKKLLENPELLELPLSEPVRY